MAGPFGNTQRLSQADLRLEAGSRLRRARWLAAAGVCIAGSAWAVAQFAGPALLGFTGSARLETENARLERELREARLELGMEHAAHAELQSHVAELEGEVAELNQQIQFLTSRAGPAR